MNVET